MKNVEGKRAYRMRARAAAAERTGQRILEAAYALGRERSLDEVRLQDIAEGAGVTVQTVLRHFGSKEGVVEAAIAADVGGIRAGRDRTPTGDLEGALDVLLAHYERDGEAVLRNLALEARVEAARILAVGGRRLHREWCARVFAPFLPAAGDPDHGPRLDAFVAATDLYLWKLFRLDLGRSLPETRAALRVLLQSLAGQGGSPPRTPQTGPSPSTP